MAARPTPISAAQAHDVDRPKNNSGPRRRLYRAVFRNAAGQASSAPATLTVNYTVTLNHRQTVAVRPGTAVTFAVQTKTPPTAVQWQSSTDRGHTWSNIAGATGITFTMTALQRGLGQPYPGGRDRQQQDDELAANRVDDH